MTVLLESDFMNSGHFGTSMYFTRQLAEAGMIGFLATNASPAVPPHGGVEKLIGNNPQSWAAPTGLETPFILDFAHSAVARGKIYLAREKGESIPADWALDADGNPGYVHDEKALRRNPPKLEFPELKEACAKRDNDWRMIHKRVVVETEYEQTRNESGEKRDKIFCLVYTIEKFHDRIPNILQTWG